MNIQRDEFVARIMKKREERKKIEAQKRRAAESEYWAYRRQRNTMDMRYRGPIQKKGVVL